jgi:hypothetical protein
MDIINYITHNMINNISNEFTRLIKEEPTKPINIGEASITNCTSCCCKKEYVDINCNYFCGFDAKYKLFESNVCYHKNIKCSVMCKNIDCYITDVKYLKNTGRYNVGIIICYLRSIGAYVVGKVLERDNAYDDKTEPIQCENKIYHIMSNIDFPHSLKYYGYAKLYATNDNDECKNKHDIQTSKLAKEITIIFTEYAYIDYFFNQYDPHLKPKTIHHIVNSIHDLFKIFKIEIKNASECANSNTSFLDVLKKKRAKKLLHEKYIIFQIIIILLIYNGIRLRHNDLSCQNVLLSFCDNVSTPIHYRVNNIDYIIKNFGYVVKICDYGMSNMNNINNGLVYDNYFSKYGIYNNFCEHYDYFYILNCIYHFLYLEEDTKLFIKRTIYPQLLTWNNDNNPNCQIYEGRLRNYNNCKILPDIHSILLDDYFSDLYIEPDTHDINKNIYKIDIYGIKSSLDKCAQYSYG